MKILKSILLIAAGFMSLIFAAMIAGIDLEYGEHNSYYGGDAYTGIQNAAAQTSRNVVELAELLQRCFTYLFIVFGFALIGCGIPVTSDKKNIIVENNKLSEKPDSSEMPVE